MSTAGTAERALARKATLPASIRIWNFLSSVKVGVALLAVLTVASIAGTLIESATDTATAQRLVYHALWFMALMIALIVNLGAATWRTTKRAWQMRRAAPLLRRPAAFRRGDLDDVREIPMRGRALTPQTVQTVLSRHLGAVHRDGPALFAQRGLIQRWGAIVTHLGIILLLLGSLYLSARAHVAGGPGGRQIWLVEGMSRDWYFAPDPDNPDRLVREPMPFRLKLHDFDADYFPNTRVPEAFTSTIELIAPDGRRSMHRVNMNAALRWHGWKFSQSSFVTLDESLTEDDGRFLASLDGQTFLRAYQSGRRAIALTDTQTDRHFPVFDADVGTCVPVPQSDLFFELTDATHFRLYRGAALAMEGQLEDHTGPFVAHAVGQLPAAYSVLSVMRESEGLKLFFYLSFLLFLCGPLLAFLASHRQVWALVDAASGTTLIGGAAHGRRDALNHLLDRVETDLREAV